MRKILVTCDCGQQMKTPRSSLGKMGTCLACGGTMRITAGNSSPLPKGGDNSRASQEAFGVSASERTDDARRRFGRAVDMYRMKRYAEALAIFDELARDYPGNPEIRQSREECVRGMKTMALLPATNGQSVVPVLPDMATIRQIVLDKVLHGSSDEIQLRAAELACKYFGFGEGGWAEKEHRENDRGSEGSSSVTVERASNVHPIRNGNGARGSHDMDAGGSGKRTERSRAKKGDQTRGR